MKKIGQIACFAIMACLNAEDPSAWMNLDEDPDIEEEAEDCSSRPRPLFRFRPRCCNGDCEMEKREGSHWPGKREGDLFDELTR